jgi:hypothetical protein
MGSTSSTDDQAPSLVLVLVFAAVLFIFPTEVVLAGPLKSNGAPVRLLGYGALFLVALGLLRHHPSRAAARANPIVVVLVLYGAQALFIYGLAAGRTLSAREAASSLRAFLIVAAACGISLYITQSVRTLAQTRPVAGVLLAGSVLNAVVGLLQASSVHIQWAKTVLLPGMAFTSPPGNVSERDGLLRALGTTSHPIEFAVCLAVSLPLGIHLSRFSATPNGRLAARLATAVVLCAVPFALSRSGLICILIAVVVYPPFATVGQRTLIALGAVLAPALAVAAAPDIVSVLQRLFGDLSLTASQDNSITGRLDDYPIVAQVFASSPWLGGTTGVSNLILDNQWLSFVVSGGLLAVAAYLALFAVPVWFCVRASKMRPRSRERSSLAGAVTAGLCATAFSSVTLDTLFFQQSWMLLFVLVGLASAVRADALAPTDVTPAPRHRS